MQSFLHAPSEQQTVQSTLIFSQHAVRRTRGEPNAHQAELAGAITSNGIDEVE
jgi:hypothetical protein